MSLDPGELYDTAELFGVDLDQVRRDHAISHVLAALSARAPETFVFFGGTMLSRTWLTDLRLSEDVDLMVIGKRSAAGATLAQAIEADIAPAFGDARWDIDPSRARDAEQIFLDLGEQITITFQLVDTVGRPSWPTQVATLHQRYTDAPPASLLVPTADAAVAMKLTAWVDRRASRDLYDLHAMAQRGMFTSTALDLYARCGQTTRPLQPDIFADAPSDAVWEADLGHQCRLQVDAREAIETVGHTLDALGRIEGGYSGTGHPR